MNNKLVSIIMPVFNAEKNVSEAIESVLNQSYPNWELLITNDKSTDNTSNVLKKYENKDKRIKVFNLEKNGGVANARNTSMSHSSGRFIAFLDSDDLWKPEKLSVQLENLNSTGGYFSCSSYEVIDENSNLTNKIMLVPNTISFKSQLNGSKIGCLTVLIDRKNILLGSFSNHGHEDYIFWQSLLKKYGNATPIQQSLAFYRIDKKSLSSNKFKMIKWQYTIYKKVLDMSLIRTLYHMSRYILNGVFKYQ